MTTTINYNDWETAYHAWEAMDQLLNAKGYPETLEAMQAITPDLRDRLLDVVNKLRMAAPAPPEEEEPELPMRRIRFPRRDSSFTNLMNIACYRYMRDDEARMLRGEVRRLPLPYGVEDTPSLRMKIENYRWAYTHMYRGYGVPHKQYATHTIRFLVEFGPSDRELDEAAEYYRTNPQ